MSTVQDTITKWRKGLARGGTQVNNEMALIWYNEGLMKFQKELLEYVANELQVMSVVIPTVAGQSEYVVPSEVSLGLSTDFYSIAQLRVADKLRSDGYPDYHVCKAINIANYNMAPNGISIGEPYVAKRISVRNPRYSFMSVYRDGKTQLAIKLYPTPTQSITAGINLTFNYINRDVTLSTDESKLLLPWYFMDAIEEYMSYKLVEVENPELASMKLAEYKETLHNNIYGANKDQRPVEEEFADLRSLYHN